MLNKTMTEFDPHGEADEQKISSAFEGRKHLALWPRPTLRHVCRMTDDCGILQHAKFWFPDYASGYCTDDNSRALIVARRHFSLFGDAASHALMIRYLAFLYYAKRPDGKMRNFVDYTRVFLEEEGSPDSLGRTLWALGHLSTIEEAALSSPAREMFHQLLPHIDAELPPHTLSYTILGLCAYGEHAARHEEAQRLVRPIARALLAQYTEWRTPDWDWFMPELTYDNARLPQALLSAGHILGHQEYIEAGLSALRFLNEVCFRNGKLYVIGCHGWYPRGGTPALFDQQPIDAGATVESNLAAYRITGLDEYLQFAVRAMNWFFGVNIHGQALYNPTSGGCHDGLHREGVNENQGAESVLAYLLAQLDFFASAPERFEPI